MKKVLPLVLISFMLVACGEKSDQRTTTNWEKLGEKNGDTTFVDTSSIKGKSEKKAWIKVTHKDETKTLQLVYVKCKDDKLASVASYKYDKAEEVTNGFEVDSPKFNSIIPETLGSQIKNFVCAR